MLLGILLVVLVLYGLLLFWVLNERLKEMHHLLRSLLRKVERVGGKVQESQDVHEEERETWSVTEEHFPLCAFEDEALRKRGEKG